MWEVDLFQANTTLQQIEKENNEVSSTDELRDKIEKCVSTLEINPVAFNETIKVPLNGKNYYRKLFLLNIGSKKISDLFLTNDLTDAAMYIPSLAIDSQNTANGSKRRKLTCVTKTKLNKNASKPNSARASDGICLKLKYIL